MKLTFLGTGAADWVGQPKTGDFRRLCSTRIGDHLLIDGNPEIMDFISDPEAITDILYTHRHGDHYDPKLWPLLPNATPRAGEPLHEKIVTFRDNESFIYRVRIDGEELRQINRDGSMFPNIHNGVVYFLNWADDSTLYSINPINPNKSYKRVYDKRVSNLNINGGYLYFTDLTAGGTLHRMDLSTGEVIKLSEDHAGSLAVAGEWLYYQNSNDGNRLYRVKTTGGGRERVGG